MTRYILILWLSGMHSTNIVIDNDFKSIDECEAVGTEAMKAEWSPPFNTPVKVVIKYACIRLDKL